MPTGVKLKHSRSNISGKRPAVNTMTHGELFVNYKDGKIYTLLDVANRSTLATFNAESNSWYGLVTGYKQTPTLHTTTESGKIYSYVYNSSPQDVTYYRYIANDNSEDAFYGTLNGEVLSDLIAQKAITI